MDVPQMVTEITLDGLNYDVVHGEDGWVTQVLHHNTEKPILGWERRRGDFEQAVSRQRKD